MEAADAMMAEQDHRLVPILEVHYALRDCPHRDELCTVDVRHGFFLGFPDVDQEHRLSPVEDLPDLGDRDLERRFRHPRSVAIVSGCRRASKWVLQYG